MKTNPKLGVVLYFLTALAWASGTSTGNSQTVLTKGCLVITCPASRTNFACGEWVVDDHGMSVSNQCAEVPTSSISVNCYPPPGAVLGVGTWGASCVVLTNGMFAARCEFYLVVKSTLPPASMECPTNRLFIIPCETETNCVPLNYDLPTVSNGILVNCDPPPGTCFPIGGRRVHCSATNDCGALSECSFDVTVTREAPLSISGIIDTYRLIPCESNCAPVTYPPPVVTNGTLVSCIPPSGTCFPIGWNSVSCRATNECGDLAIWGFSVRVIAEPPVIQCPTNENELYSIAPCGSTCEPVNYPLPEVRGGTLIECIPPPGTCFPAPRPFSSLVVHRVVCGATNDCGGLAQCGFDVRVYRAQDPGPRFRVPPFQTFTNSCGSDCAIVSYPLPYVANGWLLGCSVPSGSCMPVGTNSVRCVATNLCGYTSEEWFELRVVQGKPPPPTLRIVRQEDLHFLFWENLCGSLGLLETSDEPDGPWERLPDASPGYLVSPSESKRYFRVIVPE